MQIKKITSVIFTALGSLGIVLLQSQSAQAETFALGGTPAGLPPTYTVNGINLVFSNPTGAGSPALQRNPNGICANMTFNNSLATLLPFCGQDVAGSSTLTSISFSFSKDMVIKSYTVAAADFQNPGSAGTKPNQVGDGTVSFAPLFTNGAQVFTSPTGTLNVTRSTDTTFSNTGSSGACTTAGIATCTINFSANYRVTAGTLVTITTPTFTGSSNDGYGTLSTPGAHWRLFGLEADVAPVPGPLPIVGGAAAFGWSRKLRRRIKSVSNSAG